MNGFIDASVIVAILGRESDWKHQRSRVFAFQGAKFVSPLVLYEASLGLARAKAGMGAALSAAVIEDARQTVLKFMAEMNAQEIAIDNETANGAIDAAMRFGKTVRHPAALNLGDCFAYACAAARDAAIIHKGGDFSKTDIAIA